MFYSAQNNTWFDPSSRADYERHGRWPEDAKEFSRQVFDLMVSNRPANKVMVPDEQGNPVLRDLPPPSNEELRVQAVTDIEARRDAALRAGVVLNGVRYHTDDTFITELLGLLMGYQVGIYTGTQAIRTMDNTIVPLDAPQITAVAAAVGEHRKTVYAQSWAEKDALQ